VTLVSERAIRSWSEAVDRSAAIGAALLAGRDLWGDRASGTWHAIVMSALRSFAEQGFHGTSLKDIASGTGLSTAALYVHFRSKEELLFEISRRGHYTALAIVRDAAALPDPAEAIRVFAYAFSRWHAQEQMTARVAQYDNGALEPEHAAEIGGLRHETEQVVRSLIVRGTAEGAFAVDDARGVSAAILSLAIDVARWYTPDGPYTPDAIGRLYCQLAERLVGHPAGAGGPAT
jgi:AcrR family transcriptional regulator